MELRQLEYFLELCKVRSFTRAADNLRVSQPSITKAIRQLEQELGVPLFDRTQKPITVTPKGLYFYERVCAVLEDLNAAVAEVSRMGGGHRRTVNIGLSPWTGRLLKTMLTDPQWCPPPTLLYNLVERPGPELFTMVQEEQLSFALVMNLDLPRELSFVALEQQEIYCILPSDHPLTGLDRLQLSQLEQESFAMNLDAPNSSSLTKLIARQCRLAGFVPKVSVSLQQYLPEQCVAENLIRNGYGIMFAPVYGAREMQSVAIRPLSPPLMAEVGLCWKTGRRRTAEEDALVQHLTKQYPRYRQEHAED